MAALRGARSAFRNGGVGNDVRSFGPQQLGKKKEREGLFVVGSGATEKGSSQHAANSPIRPSSASRGMKLKKLCKLLRLRPPSRSWRWNMNASEAIPSSVSSHPRARRLKLAKRPQMLRTLPGKMPKHRPPSRSRQVSKSASGVKSSPISWHRPEGSVETLTARVTALTDARTEAEKALQIAQASAAAQKLALEQERQRGDALLRDLASAREEVEARKATANAAEGSAKNALGFHPPPSRRRRSWRWNKSASEAMPFSVISHRRARGGRSSQSDR